MTFSKQPKPSATARPACVTFSDQPEIPVYVDLFKKTYVLERRVLDLCRLSSASQVYNPAKSLDGGNRYNTPEEKPKKNQWLVAYQKVADISKPKTPIEYVRILFYSLRSSSLPTPTVLQLASQNNATVVADFAKDAFRRVQAKFIADSRRAKTEILLRTSAAAGARQPMASAVYCSLLDVRLELSPLFRYCLAVSTLQAEEDKRKADVNLDSILLRMQQYADDLEFLAAFDYTVFPEIYNSVYGASLSSRFKKLALSLVESARDA
jgi:hypothetical protein